MRAETAPRGPLSACKASVHCATPSLGGLLLASPAPVGLQSRLSGSPWPWCRCSTCQSSGPRGFAPLTPGGHGGGSTPELCFLAAEVTRSTVCSSLSRTCLGKPSRLHRSIRLHGCLGLHPSFPTLLHLDLLTAWTMWTVLRFLGCLKAESVWGP